MYSIHGNEPSTQGPDFLLKIINVFQRENVTLFMVKNIHGTREGVR